MYPLLTGINHAPVERNGPIWAYQLHPNELFCFHCTPTQAHNTANPDRDAVFRFSHMEGAYFFAHGISGKSRYDKIQVLWVGCKVHLVNPL